MSEFHSHKRINWPQLLLGVLLGATLSFIATGIRDHRRESERMKTAASQVVSAWDDEVRVNTIALQLKASVASKLASQPPEDLAERDRLITQLRSTKLSSFALKTMAVHFASLQALGATGSSLNEAMAQFYRSLERVEKEEADIFPQLGCENSVPNVQTYGSALSTQYTALEALRRKTNERVDALRPQLREQ
ncbi:MAG: hypothetical protein ACREBG_29930 [Pyrinomonadaceae bacterium]